MHRPVIVPLAVLLSALLMARTSVAAQEEHAEELQAILDGVADRWEQLPGMSARLVHTFEWVLAGETQITEGMLHLAGGDRFRIETESVTVVSDGKTLWQYTPAQNQVIIDRIDPRRPNASPEQLFVAFTRDAEAEWVREEPRGRRERTVVIRLHRAETAEPAVVEAWVDDPEMLVTRLSWSDGAGNRYEYRLYDIEIVEQPPERFVFTVPEGATVLDLRPPVGRP